MEIIGPWTKRMGLPGIQIIINTKAWIILYNTFVALLPSYCMHMCCKNECSKLLEMLLRKYRKCVPQQWCKWFQGESVNC